MDLKIIEEFKSGHRHIFKRKDEFMGERECSIQVDDPAWDYTDFAHPAYFRGQDHAVAAVVKQLQKAIDGADGGKLGNTNLQSIREWIVEHRND